MLQGELRHGLNAGERMRMNVIVPANGYTMALGLEFFYQVYSNSSYVEVYTYLNVHVFIAIHSHISHLFVDSLFRRQ